MDDLCLLGFVMNHFRVARALPSGSRRSSTNSRSDTSSSRSLGLCLGPDASLSTSLDELHEQHEADHDEHGVLLEEARFRRSNYLASNNHMDVAFVLKHREEKKKRISFERNQLFVVEHT